MEQKQPSHDQSNRRLQLRVAMKLMAGAMGLVVFAMLLTTLKPSSQQEGVLLVGLHDLKRGEARLLDWDGESVWLLKRHLYQVESLRDWDQLVRDPFSDEKPLPSRVLSTHRGMQPEYLVVLAKGEQCNVIFSGMETSTPYDNWQGGFYDQCADQWYDLAGRALDKGVYADHLQVPDYRIVGASLIIGQPAFQ